MADGGAANTRAGASEVPDLVAAALFGGLTVAVDRWLLDFLWRGYHRAVSEDWGAASIRSAEKAAYLSSTVLIGLVLLGAALGARAAGRGASRPKRWRCAALGAVLAHPVLVAVLVVAVMIHPPKPVW